MLVVLVNLNIVADNYSVLSALLALPLFLPTEHVNDMVYSVEKLNALVSAARVDLEAFKAREHHHRQSKCGLDSLLLSNPHCVTCL